MPDKDKPAKITVSDDTPDTDAVPVKVATKTEPATAPEIDSPAEATPEEPSTTDPPEDEPLDAATEQAVDDIAAQDQDEPTDETPPKEPVPVKKPKKSFWGRLFGWWRTPWKRRTVLITIFIVIITVMTVPASRYAVLNVAGVRSTATITVLDESTQQPLKNVAVTLGGQSGTTDKEGQVAFKQVKLGKNKLTLEKRAFATSEQWVVIGWGSNPLTPLSLEPEGVQYHFVLTDYLSDKPMANVEAVSGEASAVSDEDGKLTLTLESVEDNFEVSFTAGGYRTEQLTLPADTEDETAVAMVPAKSHVFISKRSGRYDVYKIDADGKNEERILAGSGVEREDLVLVPHPVKDYAVLVSTRENVRRNGNLLDTLTLIDVADKSPTKIAQSERIQIVDWLGDRLVYVKIADGAADDDPKRHRLMSYDLNSGQSKELAAANYFNDVLAVNGYVYYAPTAAYATSDPALYRSAADGSNKQTVLGQEVWNVYRTGYDKLVLAISQEWYEHQISTNKTSRLSGEPSDLSSRVYADSPDRKHSLWADQRDGKGVLLAYELAAGSDKILHQQSGLGTPLQWLSNSAIVFRVVTSQETADYVMSLDGGEPKKLKDVTNTSGIDRWYYY